jgi:hypothetical protein
MSITRTGLIKLLAWGLPWIGAVSAYQTLFSLWMCAHPVYQSVEWQHRFYLRLITTIIIGVLWLACVIWLVLKKRRSRADASL